MTRMLAEWVDERLDGACEVSELMALHARLKLVLMAYSPAILRHAGRIVASARRADRAAVVAAYRSAVKLALASEPSRGRHVNALEHMAGYFKQAPLADRRQLAGAIAAYRRGEVPLAVPLGLVRDEARRYHVDYLTEQLYLEAA